MSRIRKHRTSPEAQGELAVIDAALAGRPVDAEYDSLARFARELRATRPQAEEQFLARLDARAAEDFKRVGVERAPTLSSLPRLRGRTRALRGWVNLPALTARPTLGLALAALIAVAIVVPLALRGGQGRGTIHSAKRTPAARAEGQATPARAFTTGERAPARKSAAAAAASGVAAGANVSPPNAAAAAASGVAAGANVSPPNAAAAPARQVERTATLDIGVGPDAMQSKAHQVFTLVSGFDGYVRESSVSLGGQGQGGASFDIRLPSTNLTNAIAALSGFGHVRSENDTTNDVTDQFDSLGSSLAKLRAERASILKRLARASESSEEARLSDRLRYLDTQIAQQQSSLSALHGRVNYTALALTLTAEAAAASKHSGELTPGAAAGDAGEILEAALAVLVIAAAALLPLGALAVLAWILVTGARSRLREQALDAS